MDGGHELVSKASLRLAADLSLSTLRIVARLIENSSTIAAAKAKLIELPQPHHRELATTFLDECEAAIPSIPTPMIAFGLLTAGLGEKAHRDAQSIELVWTGPEPGSNTFRRTEQAILHVLDSARQHITLVSYAVYRIPHIRKALVRAASRGVKITVIVETPDKIEGQHEYSTLQALGPEVAACSAVYYWPQARRQSNGGKLGILHVKCAASDSRWLFLSSANLTEYAFSINMELGVLITGGGLPGQVEECFVRLVDTGLVERV